VQKFFFEKNTRGIQSHKSKNTIEKYYKDLNPSLPRNPLNQIGPKVSFGTNKISKSSNKIFFIEKSNKTPLWKKERAFGLEFFLEKRHPESISYFIFINETEDNINNVNKKQNTYKNIIT
jgi:hypothetical protein